MSKHTPGPWRVVDGFYPCISVIDGPSFTISIVMFAADISFDESMRREADARLIAAAPELLEALELLVALPLAYNMNRIEISCGSHGEAMEIVRKARAALAKANGEGGR